MGANWGGPLACLTALTNLLHNEVARTVMAGHLPLLVAVVMKGLDPRSSSSMRPCRQVLLPISILHKADALACMMAQQFRLCMLVALYRGTKCVKADKSYNKKKERKKDFLAWQ